MPDYLSTAFDIEIDKLTNSIENAVSGEVFDTEITRLTILNEKQIKKKDWGFNWKQELKDPSREVYKLTTAGNRMIIQGLLSLEDKGDHIFMHLLESAKFNQGKTKVYVGVPGNLVAYACKLAFEKSYDGYVAFDSKSVLIEHYQKMLGATLFRGQRMYIETQAASVLVTRYFKK
ncbi:hypothetical protein [Larkinella terrae]|uniref:Uncharacterized protein n=1 Tax=Larkinella terrae TaxID=2025311 RepID=A0A7K0EUI8_9BACT|nr:hypothetical protein [Larkinella terrae]MRS65470.1 hypothetical protein [Larkinella terrae]